MAEKNPLLENLNKLRDRTGLQALQCKQALDATGNEIDEAILWLRAKGLMAAVSVENLLKRCDAPAETWARDFLETTLETGELRQNYEANNLDLIQDNYYHWYVIGMPGRCPWLTLRDEAKLMTDAEHDELGDGARQLYDRAVERLLPEYVRPDWKTPG